MSKKVKKKKLNIKRTLVFLLFLYIIGYGIYILINQPIKHIEITGNKIVKDSEILRISNLKDYPSIFKYRNKTIENKIKKIELINDAKVKKWFGFKLIIEIKENKTLFYYKNTDKIALSNGNIVKNSYNNIYGLPILKSDVKSNVLSDFIKSFSILNDNIIYEMNEIEYYPLKDSTGKNITEDRFKILMIDGNTIIVNNNSISVINKYNDIYASLGGRMGTINLDSDELNNLVFIPYEE